MTTYYKLLVRRVTCLCGAHYTESSTFLYTPGGYQPHIRGMKPAPSVPPGADVRKVGLPPRTIPVCHFCIGNETIPDFVEAAAWTETLRRKQEEERLARRPTAASSTPTVVSADDLA